MTLFIVSNVQHLMLAQMVATATPGDKALLIWHMPGCGNIVTAMRQILIAELWRSVSVLPESVIQAYVPHEFPFVRARGRILKVRATVSGAQRVIDDTIKAIGAFSRLYISNTTGHVDRRLWSIARGTRIPICAIEDGLKSYLGTDIHQGGGRTLFGRVRSAIWHRLVQVGLDRFALSYAQPFSERDRLSEIHLCFPSAASAVCRQAGRVVDLSAQIGNGAFDAMVGKLDELRDLPKLPDDAWLYLSRADAEDGMLSEEQEVAVVSGLLRDVLEARGGALFIKPHPRDKKGKIEAILARTPGLKLFELSSPLPIELLAAKFQFSVCLGTWSGPLLYLPMLHRIKTYALLPVFIERARALGGNPDQLAAVLSGVRPAFEKQTVWVDGADWQRMLALEKR